MDFRNGFCSAEAGRCLLRTLPRKPQVPEDPLYHGRLQDGGDDLELAAAVRAVFEVDLKSEASAKTNLYSSYVVAKTRLSSRAQLMRAGRPCAQLGSVAVSSDLPMACSGPCGTTMARSLALGPSTPAWYPPPR